MNWYETLIVNLAVGTLRTALKKPGQAAVLKHVCLDLYQAIKAGYPEDPDFQK
jgi:hypothetical protein